MSDADIAFGVHAVRERIAIAARKAGRDPAAVTLLAATKTTTPEEVVSVVRAGVGVVGENIVKEMLAKQDALAGTQVRWDFIGTLQKNKVGKVVGRTALIHSVDAQALADVIDRRAAAMGIRQQILVEVNTSGEGTKHGFDAPALREAVEAIAGLRHVEVAGAMTMAPPRDSDAARRCFSRLAAITAEPWWPPGATELSMGMSDDFDIAIEEGATIVRIGSAIFGARCDAGLGA
ncbi:MAG: YggS family pyridoxal phosphate-dependent enzyme [Actinomycetota bacterium]|nr:YggS family pyridoxal phosphate-dependent enzyme [Actinomycetota bacterium]